MHIIRCECHSICSITASGRPTPSKGLTRFLSLQSVAPQPSDKTDRLDIPCSYKPTGAGDLCDRAVDSRNDGLSVPELLH
jgi:hypothetical protein